MPKYFENDIKHFTSTKKIIMMTKKKILAAHFCLIMERDIPEWRKNVWIKLNQGWVKNNCVCSTLCGWLALWHNVVWLLHQGFLLKSIDQADILFAFQSLNALRYFTSPKQLKQWLLQNFPAARWTVSYDVRSSWENKVDQFKVKCHGDTCFRSTTTQEVSR